MTAATPRLAGRPGTDLRRGDAGAAVTRLATRLIRRSALIVLAVSAAMTAVVVATYEGLMTDPGTTAALGALAGNPAIRTLFGEPLALDDPGGFTVWRTGTVVAVLLGVWSILATTRVTRGEEDAGRWDLLLAGRLSLRSVVVRHLGVLAVAGLLVGAAVGAALAVSGTGIAGAVVHATGIAVLGLFFVGAGALSAQVFSARSAATGAAVAVLGLMLLARMVGDGVTALAWLRWVSPFGLLEISGPYARNRWLPLGVLAVAAAVLLIGTVAAATRRDVRGGIIAAAAGRPPRTRLLGSVEAFAVRRLLRPLSGWSASLGAYFLLIGLIAVTMTEFLAENPVFADAAGQAGFASLASVEGYAATLFALLAVPVGVFAADRMSAFAAAEADRRLTLLAAQPLHRFRLIGAEILAVGGGLAVLVTVAGLATWLGVAVTGGSLRPAAALAGTWNALPVALLCLGAGVLAVGWLPRAVGAVGALPAVGGFLLQTVAESARAPRWVIDMSPFAHLAPVPFSPPDVLATAIMTGIALALGAVGMIGYRRRDLRG